MNIPINYHLLLVLCCFFLPELSSWETVTEKEKVPAVETLFEINAPPDTFMEGIAQQDEMIKDDEIEKNGKQRNDNDRFSFLHPFQKLKRSLNLTNKYPLKEELELSEHTFDLDYKTDDLSSHSGPNGQKRQRIEHSRIERDVSTTKGEAEALEYPYDYESFHREYFDYIWEKKNDSKMEPSRFYTKFANISPLKEITVCFPGDWQSGVGAIALYCTLHRGSTKGFTKAEFSRLGHILKFWAIVYLVAGGVLWMVCGWCCCCLRCKVFNPDEIRREARCYVINNPPGVMRNTHTGNAIEYMPTQEEREAHKELQIKAFAFV